MSSAVIGLVEQQLELGATREAVHVLDHEHLRAGDVDDPQVLAPQLLRGSSTSLLPRLEKPWHGGPPMTTSASGISASVNRRRCRRRRCGPRRSSRRRSPRRRGPTPRRARVEALARRSRPSCHRNRRTGRSWSAVRHVGHGMPPHRTVRRRRAALTYERMSGEFLGVVPGCAGEHAVNKGGTPNPSWRCVARCMRSGCATACPARPLKQRATHGRPGLPQGKGGGVPGRVLLARLPEPPHRRDDQRRFWAEKVEGNRAGSRHRQPARASGWVSVRVWEHVSSDEAVERVVGVLESATDPPAP